MGKEEGGTTSPVLDVYLEAFFCECLLKLEANISQNRQRFISEEETVLQQQAQEELD